VARVRANVPARDAQPQGQELCLPPFFYSFMRRVLGVQPTPRLSSSRQSASHYLGPRVRLFLSACQACLFLFNVLSQPPFSANLPGRPASVPLFQVRLPLRFTFHPFHGSLSSHTRPEEGRRRGWRQVWGACSGPPLLTTGFSPVAHPPWLPVP